MKNALRRAGTVLRDVVDLHRTVAVAALVALVCTCATYAVTRSGGTSDAVVAVSAPIATTTAPTPSVSPTPTVTVTVTETETVAAASTDSGVSASTSSTAPATSTPTTVTVKGTLTMFNILENDLDPKAECGVDGIRLVVKNGAGDTIALAKVKKTKPKEVKHDDYSLDWSCDHKYAVEVPLGSPVYTFYAYYDRLDSIKPWEATVSPEDLTGKAPSPYLSFCAGCGY